MSSARLIPYVLITLCGVYTAVTAWQPEFKKLEEERQGDFQVQHPEHAQSNPRDTAISRAIADDLKEARDQLKAPTGFAWGIRRALFGTGKEDGADQKKVVNIERADGSAGK